MTQIKKPAVVASRRTAAAAAVIYPGDVIQVLAGMVLGAVMMFWFLGSALDDTSNINSNSNSNLNSHYIATQPQQQQQLRALTTNSNNHNNMEMDMEMEKDDGWHPIHVYYHDRESMPGYDPQNKWPAQVHQDQVVLNLIGDPVSTTSTSTSTTSSSPPRYFIDLAANDAAKWTNTLALEKQGNWNGLCIEPNPGYWYGLAHRKCTVVGALVGGKGGGGGKTNAAAATAVQVKFRGVYGGIVGRLDDRLADRKKEPDAPIETRYTVPLQDVFEKFHVPFKIDYLSLDVEGAELLIMQDFPFDTYQIQILTVERPSQKLKSLLTSHGYVFLKDLAWWGETLWAHSSMGYTPDHPKIKAIITEGK